MFVPAQVFHAVIPVWVGVTVAVAVAAVAGYFIALYVKQEILKKKGGLFTAKF